MMRIIVIDVQGFFTSEFQVKELAVYDGKEMKTWIFKPQSPYRMLSKSDQKNVNYVFFNVHGIPYRSGDFDYNLIYEITKHILTNVDRVYVKGSIKKDFLLKTCSRININPPEIINLEFCTGPVPKLDQALTGCCTYHRIKISSCSVRNAYTLYNYIINQLSE